MRTSIRALLVGGCYLLAAQWTLYLHDFTGTSALFWPAAGVAVVGLSVAPRRAWPAILLAVALAEVGGDLLLGFSVVPSLWWAVANVTVALVAASLIRAWQAEVLGDVRSVVRFIVAAAIASSAGGAVGAIGTAYGSDGVAYASIVMQWAVGDGLGILTVYPLGLLLARRTRAEGLASPEGMTSLAMVTATSLLVFLVNGGGQALVGEYLILLPMIWVAVRFKQEGTAIAVFLVAMIATMAHATGRGPFTLMADPMGSAQLQLFVGVAAIAVLLLASRTAESERYQGLAATREQIVASVSHELRTPLTSIVGFGHTLAREAPAGTTARRAAEAIVRNGEHLTSLVEDLLDVARNRHGVLPTQPTAVVVVDLIAALIDGRPGSGDVHLSGGGDAVAWVDEQHLRQIVTNLLDNADRYGRPPVRVDARCDGSGIVVTVTDDGDGVPGWFVPHLFDEFSQMDTGRRRSGAGLGLGLPIARTLARANEGELTYQAVSSGARFVVTLPRLRRPGDGRHADGS